MCAAFGSPRGAIDAAIDAQRGLVLPVRMGIATGEAELRGDDYFGPALNRAARIMAAGHGGQVLVAAATAALVSGVGLVDLGERRLRDLSGAEHLFQVRAEGLRVEFPPLRTLDATPGNLPVQSTSFVGRHVEVKELCELVRAHRMVTLTGVGGVGKTRLAVQVAAELTDEFGDGVWLVELAPVGDPAAVPDVVATVLGASVQAGVSVSAAVAQALSGRRLLVVLDNCEHLIDAAAELVEAILAGASTVQVLATSREGLRVGAEQLWVVPSLGVDDGMGSAAVELFMERARSVNASFALHGDADSDAVNEICSRLDGIALAIELAAARMVSMTAQDVRDRLGDRFRLLAGGRRGLEHHQTLRHAVGWSYDLLDADERAVLCRCSVFAGGFDLAAAAHLNEGLDEYAVLDVLDSLVRKSLVTVSQVGGHARYGMLETIRQYAEDQLAATDSIAQVRDRHAAVVAARKDEVVAASQGAGDGAAVAALGELWPELRSAMAWTLSAGQVEAACALVAGLGATALFQERSEVFGWADATLALASTTTDPAARLAEVAAAGTVAAWTLGRSAEAVAWTVQADELARAGRAPLTADVIMSAVFRSAFENPDMATFVAASVDAAARARSVGNRYGELWALNGAAMGENYRGRSGAAIETAERAGRLSALVGNTTQEAFRLFCLAAALLDDDPAAALVAADAAVAAATDVAMTWLYGAIANYRAPALARAGDVGRAVAEVTATLDQLAGGASIVGVANTIRNAIALLDRLGRAEAAATLVGWNSEYPGSIPGTPGMRAHVDAVAARLPSLIEPRRLAALLAEGAGLEVDEAIAVARRAFA